MVDLAVAGNSRKRYFLCRLHLLTADNKLGKSTAEVTTFYNTRGRNAYQNDLHNLHKENGENDEESAAANDNY